MLPPPPSTTIRNNYADATNASTATADGAEAKAPAAQAASNVERKHKAREWDERYGKLTDLSAFQREILPLIQGVPLSRLQRATGLSLRYVSLIRRGAKIPHPRHWQRLRNAAEDR
jgi:hypothetical protein